RRRSERHLVDSVVLAVERERLTAPEARDDRKPFVKPLGAHARVEGLMHVREAGIAGGTGAEADDKPAVRELIDRRRLARGGPRPSPWQRDDLDPEPDLTGPNRHSRDRDPRVARRHRRVPLVPDVVLEKDPVPAGCLRELRELDEETRVTALTPRRQTNT